MTRKDFELIARVIKDADELADAQSLAAIAENLAQALATTNPAFDAKRFLTACGVN